VHQLLLLAGFTTAEWELGEGKTVSTVVDYWESILGDSGTYWDHLDQLLYEHGYLFHFGEDGKFRIDDAFPGDTSSGDTFDSGNMIGELQIGRKAERYEGAEVQFMQHYTNTNVVLFRDTTGGTANYFLKTNGSGTTSWGLAQTVATKINTDSPVTAAVGQVILCNAASGAITVNLPDAASSTDFLITVKKIDSSDYAVTIDGNAAETIDGAATRLLTLQYESLTLVCDGSNWYSI
jgi:hypothetical protein